MHHSLQAGKALGISSISLTTGKSTIKLSDYYNKDLHRFEFKSHASRNNGLKILERNGFDYELVEDLKGYAVSLPKSARYAVCIIYIESNSILS